MSAFNILLLCAVIAANDAFTITPRDQQGTFPDPYSVDFLQNVEFDSQPSAKLFWGKWNDKFGSNNGRPGSGSIGNIPNGSWWDQIRNKFPFLFGSSQRMAMPEPGYWYYAPNPNFRPVYAEPMTPSTQNVGSVITVSETVPEVGPPLNSGYYYPRPENPLELPGAVQFKSNNGKR